MGSENVGNSDAFGREDPRTSCSPGEISVLDMHTCLSCCSIESAEKMRIIRTWSS